MPPWILVLTTLAVGGGSNSVSVETTTVRIANELTCWTMAEDFTYDRTVNGVRVTGRARCYLDAPDVVVPGRP